MGRGGVGWDGVGRGSVGRDGAGRGGVGGDGAGRGGTVWGGAVWGRTGRGGPEEGWEPPPRKERWAIAWVHKRQLAQSAERNLARR